MLLPGAAPGLPWEEAARRAREHVEALRADARRLRVRLALEPVSQLRMDLCFLQSFHDALDFADRIDAPEVGVVLELNNAWIERHLDSDLQARPRRIAVVQVSDFKVGTLRASERVMIGDGDIPLRRLVRALADAGYDGWYDLEMLGPAIDAAGYEQVVPLAMARFRELWT
jgi:sugar phosphate isomerase/epimerase